MSKIKSTENNREDNGLFIYYTSPQSFIVTCSYLLA